MSEVRPQILETVGWPTERVAAGVGLTALFGAVASPAVSWAAETFTDFDIHEEAANFGVAASLTGLAAFGVYCHFGRKNQTVRDKHYD